MLVRLIVCGAIGCGLIATDSAALADSASGRMFKGKTAQGHAIKLMVGKQMLKIRSFGVDLKCRNGSALLLDEGDFLWTRMKSGSFRDAQFGKTDGVYFRGRVSGRRVRGRLRVTDKEKRGPRCASRWIAFSATPR